MRDQPRLLIIIVNYQSTREVHHQLTKIVAMDPLSQLPSSDSLAYDICIWDNSGDLELGAEYRNHPSVRVLGSGVNLGYGGGIQAVISHYSSDSEQFRSINAFLFLNPDLEIHRTGIQRLYESLHNPAYPQLGAVGPRILKGDGTPWGSVGRVHPRLGLTSMSDTTEHPTSDEVGANPVLPHWSYIPGCALMIKKSAYFEVGGMPSHTFLYFEETELCVRLQMKGYQLRVIPSVRAIHRSLSYDQGVPSASFSYYFPRASFVFFRRVFRRGTWLQALSVSYIVLKEILLPSVRHSRSLKVILNRLRLALSGAKSGFMMARGLGLFLTLFFASACNLTGPQLGSYTMIDVTDRNLQADTHLLELNGVNVLIDAGDRKHTLVPFLLKRKIETLDWVIITHPHVDHYGGLESILSSDIQIKNLVFPEVPKSMCEAEAPRCQYDFASQLRTRAREMQVSLAELKPGDVVIDRSPFMLRVLYRYDGINTPVGPTDINDTSYVLKLSHQGSITTHILFTGDLNHRIGTYLSETAKDLNAQILKVPHHGTEGTVPNSFFDQVGATVAWVPAPAELWHQDRSQRLRDYFTQRKAQIKVSGIDGTVRMRFYRDGVLMW